jgi:hypothetical protein
MSGYLMLIGENARAVEIGERGLAIADRTGDVAWAIYRLLPFVIENSLYLEDYERAARHNARLRRESERLGHALGLAWADATDALLTYLTGECVDAVPLLRAAAGALEAVPFVFDAARLRRLIGRAMVDAGDREGAERELRRAHEVFVRTRRAGRDPRDARAAARTRRAAAVGRRGGGRGRGRRVERARGGDRAAGRRAEIQQGDRRGARHLVAHREHAPVEHLRQARCGLARRAHGPGAHGGTRLTAGDYVARYVI